MTRVLAVDYGRVRVGLAVSDPLGHTARPLEVLPRPKRGSLVDAVVAVARREEAERIVVGLPLRLDASEGVAAEAVRSFAKALEERSGLPVELWDERLSTTEATRQMRAAGIDARRQRGTVDKVAAAVILRSWLDARVRPDRQPDEATLPEVDLPQRHPRDELDAEPRAHRSRRAKGERRRGTTRGSRTDWRE